MQISDFLVDKYKKLFYLKKLKSFSKAFDNFLQTLAKESLGSVLFGRVGRVTAKIHAF